MASHQPAAAVGQQPTGRVLGKFDPESCLLQLEKVEP
jgi:hypothetical protein